MYICDDSESMESRHQIDKFVEFVADKCTVIRRENLKGWKAGNLNHCLYLLPKNFPYFMVVDHDNHVCPGMIQHAIGRFNRNPNLAFVQFPLEENCDSNTSFADDFQFSTRSVWWTLSIREKHGFRFNVGHTVLFRNEHVRKVEGFPENVLTEDLAITMRLLNHGYAGEYDLSITARESVPHTYQRYRSRHIRWCIGTSQSWLNPSVRLSKKRNPLSIIFDASLLSMQLLYSFPFLIMSLGLGLASHDLSYSITHAGLFFKMVTILSLLCPNLPLLCVARKSGKAIRLLAVNTAVYLSIIVPSVVSVLSALLSRRADFINTGNRVVSNKWNINQPIYRSFTANGPGTIFIECVVAFWFMLHIKNVGLQGLPIFMGIICGPIFTFFEWDSLLVKVAKYLPLLFIFISFILMLYQL